MINVIAKSGGVLNFHFGIGVRLEEPQMGA